MLKMGQIQAKTVLNLKISFIQQILASHVFWTFFPEIGKKMLNQTETSQELRWKDFFLKLVWNTSKPVKTVMNNKVRHIELFVNFLVF